MWTLFDRAGQAVRIGDAELASMERRILSAVPVDAASEGRGRKRRRGHADFVLPQRDAG